MTFILVFLFVTIFVIVSSSRANRATRRMLFLFVGYWAVALILSSVGVQGYDKPSFMAFMLLYANVLMFVIGFFIFPRSDLQKDRCSSSELHAIINKLIDSNLFTFLLFVATALSVVYFIRMRVFYEYVGDLNAVRDAYFDHSMLGYEFIWLNHLFLEPMRFICIPLFGYMLFFKRNWKFIMVSVFLLLFLSLAGGRFGYLRMALGVIFIIYCMFNDIKFNVKHVFFFVIAMLGFVYLMAIVTYAKSTGESSLSESAITAFSHYLCGPMSAFDYAIHSNYIDRMGGYTFGRLSFSSVDGLFGYILQVFGIHYDDPVAKLAAFKQGERIFIGQESWNAQYTSQLFPWLDAGVFGCILFPLLFGRGFRFLVDCFYKYKHWTFFVLLSAFFQIIMHSISDFDFTSPFTLLAFIMLFYFGKKSIKRSNYNPVL